MPAQAHNLRELHELHQRARALRDRLASGPKTLAHRQSVLAKQQADLETARKELLDLKATVKRKEVELKALQDKLDDLRVKLNTIKKQNEYDAIRNQIAHDNLASSKLQEEILQNMMAAEEKTAALAVREADVKKLQTEIEALRADFDSQAAGWKTQLAELDTAIAEAEEIIEEKFRDQYRRLVKQRGPDALAPVEDSACTGCFVAVTAQMLNHLILCDELIFCKSCGRLLYMPTPVENTTRRK
jgi:predicted  nucleic acid-binding Zn-ribbon protein